MAGAEPKFAYQRLKNEIGALDYDEHDRVRARKLYRFRRIHLKRKIRLKVPVLRRFVKRKAKQVRFSVTKILKRLKESQAHFGDLFAGNYMFMQVTPTPLKCVHKSGQDLKSHVGSRLSFSQFV